VNRSTRWRKSTRSGSGNACVEIRDDLHAVRDSKNPGGPVLTVRELSRLIETVKDGS
jgi:hypothetical protein